MLRRESDEFDPTWDDSLAALNERARRQQDEQEIPTKILMWKDVPPTTTGSRGPRVRAWRKKVIPNRIGDTNAEPSQKKIGRPKSRVKRRQFGTMIASETRETLRNRKMRLSALLDLWIHTLIRTLEDEEIDGRTT